MSVKSIDSWKRGAQGALLMLCALTTAAWGAEPSPELRDALDVARPADELAIIVTYRSDVNANGVRRALSGRKGGAWRRAEVLRQMREQGDTDAQPLVDLVRERGAADVKVLWITNAIALRAKPGLVGELLADPRVVNVRLDGFVDAPIAYAGEPLPAEWNVSMVNAPALWARGYHGAGVVVAVLDSGVDPQHPDLATAYRGGTNSWLDPYGEHAAPRDLNGHGTQAAGLAIGGGTHGTQIGVAPGAKWIAAKIFNDAGVGTESGIHQAFQWLLDPDGNPATDDAPDIVNNSWGITDGGGCNTVFQPDIDALRAADIAVVFSGGNAGPGDNSSESPANNAHVTSVGAVNINRRVAEFSSRGPSACDGTQFPKVVAPGDGVLTTDLSFGGSPYYVLVSGTSFAAPHVAGVMALLKGAQPLATANDLETAVRTGAVDIEGAGPDPAAGYGLVDAQAALGALAATVDVDGDGYRAPADCNDDDSSVHPGATERRRDDIDQDCNGYDLTIDIKYAVYTLDGSTLRLRASSLRGAAAALELAGVGPLTWRPRYKDWIYEGAVAGTPLQLTVRGAEGDVGVTPRPPRKPRN